MHAINEYIDHSLIACMQAGADHRHQNSKNPKESTPKKPSSLPPHKEKEKKKNTHIRTVIK
jgi:hypothetical protein